VVGPSRRPYPRPRPASHPLPCPLRQPRPRRAAGRRGAAPRRRGGAAGKAPLLAQPGPAYRTRSSRRIRSSAEAAEGRSRWWPTSPRSPRAPCACRPPAPAR
jgi:hypothetical protein